MDPDPKSYILSESESRAIFESKIVPAELPPGRAPSQGPITSTSTSTSIPTSTQQQHRPHHQPLAVFVIGQTGAGKTRTAPALKTAILELRGGHDEPLPPPAHFIADTYKAYHPAYAQLISISGNGGGSGSGSGKPGMASAATGPDARRWLAMAARRAMERGLDVLLESACRHPGDFKDLARAFKEEGQSSGEGGYNRGGGGSGAAYRVEVALVAVPRALSLLGILTRFHARLPEAGSGSLPARLTPRKVHDDSYAGVLDAAAFVDASGVVDQVVVVRRDNLVAYANERIDDDDSGGGGGGGKRWLRPGSTVDAVAVERRRPLTDLERATAEADLQRLRDMKVPNIEAQLEEIEALLLQPAEEVFDGFEFPLLKPWQLPAKDSNSELNKTLSLRLGGG